jgi:hypothetical protein
MDVAGVSRKIALGVRSQVSRGIIRVGTQYIGRNSVDGDLNEGKRTACESLTGLWWVSWIGIIAAFLVIGVRECWQELSSGGAADFFRKYSL